MALALVRCSIEADQGGTPHARARVSLVSWEGGKSCIVYGSARSSECEAHGPSATAIINPRRACAARVTVVVSCVCVCVCVCVSVCMSVRTRYSCSTCD